jgi:transcription antitermination factor NusG
VGLGKVPIPIDPIELEGIRLAIASGRSIEPWRGLKVGNTVRIEYGPLRGIEGLILRFKGANHLILGIQLLQRSVAVELDETWVMPTTSMRPFAHPPEIRARNASALPPAETNAFSPHPAN